MARIAEPTTEQEAGYRAWVAERPPNVREVAERFDPWSLYLLKPTNQRVMVRSFSEGEDGRVTVRVLVSGEFNLAMFEREVFGIDPNDLEPCEVPSANELTGSLLSPEQVDENIDALRVMARPDLWVMGPDGTAQRKP